MNAEIKMAVEARGIRRLCHFTPCSNLFRIIQGEMGILATAQLSADERAEFNQTDIERWDHKPDHICTSIEYPNTYFFNGARNRRPSFPDWAVLFINRSHIWSQNAWFSAQNAATARGSLHVQGASGFNSLFGATIRSAGGRVSRRMAAHLACCPTDIQAEVMLPDSIPYTDIFGIAFSSATKAQDEHARLRMLGISHLPDFYVVPDFFDRTKTWELVTNGQRPVEQRWNPND